MLRERLTPKYQNGGPISNQKKKVKIQVVRTSYVRLFNPENAKTFARK